MVRITLVLSALMLVVSACAGKKALDSGTANIGSLGDMELCEAYGNDRNADGAYIKTEILKRKLFNAEEMTLIDERKVLVGMRECALFAALPAEEAEIRTNNDFPGDTTAKLVSFECKTPRTKNIPFCPITTYEIRNGRVLTIILEK
jgi:hypothetical protein